MAIVSSQQQPTEPERKPKQRQESTRKRQTRKAPEENLLQPTAAVDEQEKQEESLRPPRLADYIGQKELKEVLLIAIQAAKNRGEPLDHLLLYGPPGLGKTTMSLILAAEMEVNCKITTAPALERPRDIVGLLMSMKQGDILFIDEIHRLTRMAEELLYPAMEDFRVDITIGKGQSAKTRSLPLLPFTATGVFLTITRFQTRCRQWL